MISIILNVYKRPPMLDRQIEAIMNQTLPVHIKDVHVWYNDSGIDQPPPSEKGVRTYRSSWNTKFFGRFMVPLLCQTEYVAMFDDDVLPGPRWLENCLATISTPETNGILGGSGVIIKDLKKNPLRYHSDKPTVKVGWNGMHLAHAERVDFVGHAWFFRQEWAKYLWFEKPYTWDNGEDMMFSYLAQKYGRINTYVPPHSVEHQEMWCTDVKTGMRVGRDENASWRLAEHTKTRAECWKHCIDNGWQTVNNL